MTHRSPLLPLALLSLTACPGAPDSGAADTSGAAPEASSTSADEQPTTADPATTGEPTTTRPTTTSADPTTTTTTTGDDTTGPLTTLTTTVDTSDATDTDTDPASTATSNDEMSSTGDTSSGTTGDAVCTCKGEQAGLHDRIFLLSSSGPLWTYDPKLNSFEFLGVPDCGLDLSMFSMAVDRDGFAWVMFQDPPGTLRKVDLADPSKCTDPGYVPGQDNAELFGMAFVSNSADDPCDRLYGNTKFLWNPMAEGPGIGNMLTLNPDSLLIEWLGPTNYNGGELTGTGDGRLFLFGGKNPAKLTEYDKSDATEIATLPLPGLEKTDAFAMAFFAGDFYIFTESSGWGSPSKVTRLDYDDSDNNGVQDLETVYPTAPLRVVGAGVSTCAPYLPM